MASQAEERKGPYTFLERLRGLKKGEALGKKGNFSSVVSSDGEKQGQV